ncbi:PQ-loop-domain-containing protein [Stereum hirsutum FP-91666 SS1]|uniref:PQ-loop-domain-containing protein n=1 Tax=Stereum hirsutum (strain FP-91666) TaxID=721885 RepID=UPI000444958B|nr:PQ-loop-domain-containing protein [Stereum hirsutum FP-91666 SS1]EIM86055.1 PQ-loop-domain-containing protein [Stereum hirsutum FP-91666 SS1]
MIASSTDTLSSVLGWISIACWAVVYSPQILENYHLKSGEGLSVYFVLIWLAGDISNLAGSILANLLPTVIILAAYYSTCDIILLFQIYYYRRTNKKTRLPSGATAETDVAEDTPLLTAESAARSTITTTTTSLKRKILQYSAAITFICAAGVVAWAISEKMDDGSEPSDRKEVLEWKSQLLGWLSAILFLGARVPQIRKNFTTKCEGLSPGLFTFSIMGNVTYGLSIIVTLQTMEQFVANAAWLAGSLLTVFLDVFVLSQFFYYRSVERVYMGEERSAVA